jgi:hypothetical protein
MKQQYRWKKAQYLQNWIKKKLLKTFKHLKKSDIRVAKTGEHGIDIKLSRIAKRLVPYQIEAKNTQRFKTIYTFYKQGKKYGDLETVLIIKQNTYQPLVIIDANHFFNLIK